MLLSVTAIFLIVFRIYKKNLLMSSFWFFVLICLINFIVMKEGYQVFEVFPSGYSHSVSKVYPTWLGAKRVCNSIAKEHCFCVGYRYIVLRISLL